MEPPKGLTHSVMTQIHQEKTRNKPKAILSRMRFTLVAAVIALVVVAAGTYLGHPRDNISAAAQAESAAVAEAAEAPAEPVAGEAALAAPPKVGATAEQPEAETEVDTQDAGAEEYADDTAPEAEGRSFDSAMEDTVESGASGTAPETAVAALEALGYQGTLLEVSATEETLRALLPDAKPIELENGDTVYQVSQTAYDSVMDQLPSMGGAVMESKGNSDETYVYLLLK